jgi:hypothetical protein
MAYVKPSHEAVMSACQGIRAELAEFIADEKRPLELRSERYQKALAAIQSHGSSEAGVLRAIAFNAMDNPDAFAERKPLETQLVELKEQLRAAQDVIDKHVTDGIEGLHCVGCVAEDDEVCDCPLLAPIWKAMKGYKGKGQP